MAIDKTLDLTDKQIFFCREYLIDLNATQAAIRAGYSQETAGSIGSENLTKPEIQDYIQDLKEKRSKRLEITSDKVLIELGKIAFSDLRKVYGVDGQLLPIQSIDDDTAGAISALKSYEEKVTPPDSDEQIIQITNREVKLHDKIRALEMIGKHIGFFEKDNVQQAQAIISALPLKIEIVMPIEE